MSLAKAIARAWRDKEYKSRLTTDPHAALQEVGVEIRDGANIKVVENSPNEQHLVLPEAPPNADTLSEAELEAIAGGTVPTIILPLPGRGG